MRNKNLIIKNYTSDNTYNHCSDLFDYLNKKGVKLSYVYENVFDFFQLNVGNIVSKFHQDYYGPFERINFKIKYLSDCLLHQKTKTCFTAKEVDGKLILAKGLKKQIACAITQNFYGHALITSKNAYGRTLLNENELFDLLKSIDPSAETFTIHLQESNGIIEIDYIENSKTIGNWFHLDEEMEKLFHTTKLSPISKVLTLNYNNDTITSIENLANQYTEYNHIVLSSTIITLEYLTFVQCDFYLKKKNRIGIGKNLLVFNRYDDGITNKISNPLE